MQVTNLTVFINRPIDEVFSFAADAENLTDWMPNLVMNRTRSRGQLEAGARFEQDYVVGGKLAEMVAQIVNVSPRQKWSYIAESKEMWIRRTFVFEMMLRGTKVHMIEERLNRGFMSGLMSKLKTGEIESEIKAGLEKLKRELENLAPRVTV